MGVHARAMSWYTSPPGSPAPGSAAEAQHALSSSPRGGDASFDTNMVIVLAALLFALLFALGINSLARCLIRWRARRAPAGEGAGAGTGTGGLEKRVLRSMPVEVYGAAAVAADAEVCAICLGEFADGEKVRVLPRCAHGFHVRCVDTWLLSHDSCPTCRRSVLDGATKAASSAAPVGGGGRRQGSEAAAIAVVIG